MNETTQDALFEVIAKSPEAEIREYLNQVMLEEANKLDERALTRLLERYRDVLASRMAQKGYPLPQ